ncbi:MAG TPA: Gfo/Idh/MocA family oxidoreductase [Verrucomicrobiae bacterium]|nr:Gfo/Idh/MocA family oxidoreductase [Verrucomicrobiae bacterium]
MKKFNVGIIGYGWAATAHIAAINATTLGRVTAICSKRKLEPAELESKYGSPIRVYREPGALLADPDVQVVSICGLPAEHAGQIIQAARAGKHLIIEKPVCLRLEDLSAVQDAVSSAGVRTCVCFECRFSNQFRSTKALLDRGLLGNIHYGEIDYYHGIGPWYGQFRWNTSQAQGGSALLSAGCHAIDALLFCMGNDVQEVLSASTKSSAEAFAPYEYPSTSVTLLKFKNGTVGKSVACIDCLQPYYFHTHLVGSKGSLLDNKFHSTDLHTGKEAWNTLGFKPLDSGDVSDHPYQTQFEAFFSALAQGKEMPFTSLAEAARTHRVIFAADESAKTGRPVQIR